MGSGSGVRIPMEMRAMKGIYNTNYNYILKREKVNCMVGDWENVHIYLTSWRCVVKCAQSDWFFDI